MNSVKKYCVPYNVTYLGVLGGIILHNIVQCNGVHWKCVSVLCEARVSSTALDSVHNMYIHRADLGRWATYKKSIYCPHELLHANIDGIDEKRRATIAGIRIQHTELRNTNC